MLIFIANRLIAWHILPVWKASAHDATAIDELAVESKRFARIAAPEQKSDRTLVINSRRARVPAEPDIVARECARCGGKRKIGELAAAGRGLPRCAALVAEAAEVYARRGLTA